MENKQIIYKFWEVMASCEFSQLSTLFNDTAIIEWPNTKECFHVDEFIKINQYYPGKWKETILNLHQFDDKIISETLIHNPNISFIAISIFTIKDSKIIYLKEYYSENGEMPLWRKQKEHLK